MSRITNLLYSLVWAAIFIAAFFTTENRGIAADTAPSDTLSNTDVEGFTDPYRTINVSTSEQGVIAEIVVKEGETIRCNQLLATLDTDVLEATKNIAKANMEALGKIKSATAAVNLRKERYEKLKELQAAGHAHPEEVLRAETEYRVAEAELLAAKEDQNLKRLEFTRIESQISRRKIISPIDGYVTKINKEISEAVSITDPVVLTVVQCDKLKIMFPVPAAEAYLFTPDKKVKIRFAENVEPADGVVEVVSQVTDPESDTVRVKVVIDNSQGIYRSGMACFLKISAPHQGLTVINDKLDDE